MRNAHGKESKIRGQETNIIQKNDILRGHNLGPRMACIWRFGKLVEMEGGWRLMPKFGTGRQLSKIGSAKQVRE